MADLPISFSDAMVRAIRVGAKTQTRRLATSPLARVKPGDRLYVREAFRLGIQYDRVGPLQALKLGSVQRWYMDEEVQATGNAGRRRFAREMPKLLHRMHLVVSDIRVQQLHDLTDNDAIAEGLIHRSWEVEEGDDCEIVEGWSADRFIAFQHGVGETPRDGFRTLWDSLHAGRSSLSKQGRADTTWSANPGVVAISFEVVLEPLA